MKTILPVASVPNQDAEIFAGPPTHYGSADSQEHYGCTECAHHVVAPSEVIVEDCPLDDCDGDLVWFQRTYPSFAA